MDNYERILHPFLVCGMSSCVVCTRGMLALIFRLFVRFEENFFLDFSLLSSCIFGNRVSSLSLMFFDHVIDDLCATFFIETGHSVERCMGILLLSSGLVGVRWSVHC